MIETIYCEKEVENHPKTIEIRSRYAKAAFIPIDRYSEVFNRKGQNFRLQKLKPALILAKKHGQFLLPIPQTFSLGRAHNYYFSHLLNCPFDCSYCFLQGLYQSAHYVLFVNFEEFQHAIIEKTQQHEPGSVTLFSGYDGDSLALEALTGFCHSFLPFFQTLPDVELELRTKSIHIRHLLKTPPLPNVCISFTLNPPIVADLYEKKAPPFAKRVEAIQLLQKAGWQIGLRFDPVIYFSDYQHHYREMFRTLFSSIDLSLVHSTTLGPFRLPKPVEKKMVDLLPFDPLLASIQKEEVVDFCEQELSKYLQEVFVCRVPS